MNNIFQNIPLLLQKFNEFRNNFTGDPKEEVQKLLDSGKMSQQQFNELSQTAKQLTGFFSQGGN